MDSMDEISISGKSLVWEVNKHEVLPPREISPEYFGFKVATLAEIKGGTPEDNAEMLRSVLRGEKGPKRDVVVMNAAAAMVVGNLASDLREGARIAEEVIDNGQALEKVDALVKLSQQLS